MTLRQEMTQRLSNVPWKQQVLTLARLATPDRKSKYKIEAPFKRDIFFTAFKSNSEASIQIYLKT